jgi:metal-sulfur cluster biosynthetic enzyme
MATEQEIKEALKSVVDPEIGIDIINLGLIYEIKISETGEVHIKMTLTTPFCPLMPQLKAQAESAAASVKGVTKADVEMVFDPPWDPAKMASQEAKDTLGIW